MPPGSPPPTLPPWAKILWKALPPLSAGLQEVLDFYDNLQTSADAEPDIWMRVQVKWQLLTNNDNADRYVTTWDFVNYTNGAPDSTWTTTDFTQVEGHLDTFINGGYLPHASNQLKCFEYRWYQMMFNPVGTTDPDTGKEIPYAPSGPPVRITPKNFVGSNTSTGPGAPQVSMTITDLNPYPKHHGRTYMPLPSPAIIQPSGHFDTTVVDQIGTAAATMYGACYFDQLIPVTTITQIQKQPARALLATTQVQVDDVPDVIRRRRPKLTTHRYVNT